MSLYKCVSCNDAILATKPRLGCSSCTPIMTLCAGCYVLSDFPALHPDGSSHSMLVHRHSGFLPAPPPPPPRPQSFRGSYPSGPVRPRPVSASYGGMPQRKPTQPRRPTLAETRSESIGKESTLVSPPPATPYTPSPPPEQYTRPPYDPQSPAQSQPQPQYQPPPQPPIQPPRPESQAQQPPAQPPYPLEEPQLHQTQKQPQREQQYEQHRSQYPGPQPQHPQYDQESKPQYHPQHAQYQPEHQPPPPHQPAPPQHSAGWTPLFNADMTPSPSFHRLMQELFSALDPQRTGLSSPETYSDYLDACGAPPNHNIWKSSRAKSPQHGYDMADRELTDHFTSYSADFSLRPRTPPANPVDSPFDPMSYFPPAQRAKLSKFAPKTTPPSLSGGQKPMLSVKGWMDLTVCGVLLNPSAAWGQLNRAMRAYGIPVWRENGDVPRDMLPLGPYQPEVERVRVMMEGAKLNAEREVDALQARMLIEKQGRQNALDLLDDRVWVYR